MKKLLTKTIRFFVLIVMLFTLLELHAQNTFQLTIQNVHQTSDRVLEFDFYLLDTGTPSFELASLQFGFMVNSSIYTGGTLSVSDIDTYSGLVTNQRCTAIPNATTKIGNQTEVKLVFPLVTAGSGTTISKTSPGTLLTHFILTSSVAFPPNSNPGLAFNASNVVTPYYGTKIAQFIGSTSTPLDVNLGTTNAYVVGTQPNLNNGSPTSFTAVASTDWNTPSTWGTIGVPTFTDDVTIPSGYTVTINPADAYCKSLTVGGSLSFTSASRTLNVNGDLTVSGTITTGANTIVLNGSTSGAGTINAASGTLIYEGLSAQTISNIATNTLNNLLITNKIGVTLPPALTVSSLLTIYAGAKLTNPASATLTVKDVSIESDVTNGTGTFVDNGTTNYTTGGIANVQQYLTSGRNWYISSPVSAAPTSIVTGAGSLWSYTEANSGTVIWNSNPTGNLEVTTGYVANMNADGVISFSGGVLNTGVLTKSGLTRTGTISTGFNLVGNPYPSYVNWINVLAASTNLDQTIWYRTKNNATPTSAYVFDTFNAAATPGVGTNNNGFGAVIGDIPPMQAFWVRVASGTGTLSFNNSMRSHQDQSVSTNRLRSPSISKSTQQLLRLQVSNGINSDESIVYFNPNASDGYDKFDSEKMSNNSASIPEIFTLADGKQLVINGLKNEDDDRELALGFKTGTSNTFTIKPIEVSNFKADTRIILKDYLLKTEQDITNGSSYTFTSDIANTSTRFGILFKSTSSTTGIDNIDLNSNTLIYKNSNNQVVINNEKIIGNEGEILVLNMMGQKLISTSTTGSSTLITIPYPSGVYFVTLKIAGVSTTKKIIN